MSQIPDTAPGPYYVSVVRDWKPEDARLVSGPYATHAEALALVDKARRIVEDRDPRAAFFAFGTVRMKEAFDRPGALQSWGYGLDLERSAP
jgi:hypothetical protein